MSAAARSFVLLLLALVPTSHANIFPRYASPDEVIADINVERVNVFDPMIPGEDWRPFQIANKIHFVTREKFSNFTNSHRARR